MEPPFFNSHYQTPLTPQFFRVPVRQRPIPTRTPSSSSNLPRKVVSIPIRYVNSTNERSDAILKIQKTFRGFRVRKPMKKILELKREVDAVEKKLQERETMAVLKGDRIERLKVNEGLMWLLFKLDSTRVFNDEIRGCRKAVIRKAIMLQELVDSAMDDGVVEERDSEEIADGENSEKSEGIVENTNNSSAMFVKNSATMEEEREAVINDETLENSDEAEEHAEDVDEAEEQVDDVAEVSDDSSKIQVEESEQTADQVKIETVAASNDTWECVGGETEEQKSDFVEESEEDDHGEAAENRESKRNSENRESKRNSPEKGPSNEDWFVIDGGEEEEEKRKKEKLLERMAEDNKRLVAMMADLCEKNAVQTSLICSLSQRVEHLEKAMSDRLRKKKKKLNASLI
ncbi:uncharacterized protein [Spinacia oleracea]|uniref:BAG domain-containing protein n=1 Tax=Spinacia oleracea TaxID=3562 RepID=A0A9R0ID31_SPIOL|nr:uncharacterized protein LOC110785734 [Spinacia oleracea]